MVCFEDLSDDILYLCLDYLRSERSSTLRCLRLVSKGLNIFADSIVYRTIILEEDNVFQEQASYRSIERLLDPTDVLRRHVRFLHVRSFRGDEESYCMNTKLLMSCLHSIQKLDSFSWDTAFPLPGDLLNALHQCHPSAQLCVSLKLLDHAVVSSAQLHRLSVSIPCSDVTKPDSVAPFEQLRRILIESRGLRALSVDIHQDLTLRQAAEKKAKEMNNSPYTPCVAVSAHEILRQFAPSGTTASNELEPNDSINKVQIPFESTDRSPPLEELSIKARTYHFDHDHCIRLRECMDWTKLKRLSLGPSNPTVFFETFSRKIPLLEHLDFSYHSRPHTHFPYLTQATLKACSSFITSLGMLKVLVIRCDLIDFKNHFWHTLARTHGERLQELSLQARNEGLEAPICRTLLGAFLASFTSLTKLELALSTCSPPYCACNNCSGPMHALISDYIKNVPFLASLETLQISVRIHPSYEQSLHTYIADHAHCAIRNFWAFYANQPFGNSLENFSIHFWRWETPSAHAEQNGTARVARIKKVVFESMGRDSQLVVRTRDDRKTITTRYDKVWREADGEGQWVTYIAAQQYVPSQPFILSDRFHSALIAEQPSGGRRVSRWSQV